MVRILSRRTKNNPVLIGEPGVGKTAVVDIRRRDDADGTRPGSLRPSKFDGRSEPASYGNILSWSRSASFAPHPNRQKWVGSNQIRSAPPTKHTVTDPETLEALACREGLTLASDLLLQREEDS